jgi:hypothetical protein
MLLLGNMVGNINVGQAATGHVHSAPQLIAHACVCQTGKPLVPVKRNRIKWRPMGVYSLSPQSTRDKAVALSSLSPPHIPVSPNAPILLLP